MKNKEVIRKLPVNVKACPREELRGIPPDPHFCSHCLFLREWRPGVYYCQLGGPPNQRIKKKGGGEDEAIP